jgi:thiamine-phosphate diphosphorylase
MTVNPVLPSTYLVTPEPTAGLPWTVFIAELEQSLEAGVRLVQLRAKSLSAQPYTALAELALACCHKHGARLLLNAPADVALALHADGVHLTSTRLMACRRRPLPSTMLVSVACHGVQQVLHANRAGADLITVSPVLATATHPDAEPLGWARFAALAALTDIPVYALGGMNQQHVAQAHAAGAQGIAAIRSLWGATASA